MPALLREMEDAVADEEAHGVLTFRLIQLDSSITCQSRESQRPPTPNPQSCAGDEDRDRGSGKEVHLHSWLRRLWLPLILKSLL